jgi:hypothetical protein
MRGVKVSASAKAPRAKKPPLISARLRSKRRRDSGM